MKKAYKLSKETSNNREYKSTMKHYRRLCPYCKPHQGCNKNPNMDHKSWKTYRKTQYRYLN